MNKKKYKYLNIKGSVLDNNQLQNYMEKIASEHDIVNHCDRKTYPILRLKDNFKFIEKTYEILNKHLKLKIDIHPAGEWLLDNFYIIEETYKTIIEEMNIKKYKNFPGLTNGIYKGFARNYVLASEIASYTDSKIDDEILRKALISYQKRKLLSMEEIWNLWIFLEIALIENIRNICEKIYYTEVEKYKVENIIERLVDNKLSKNLLFKNPVINKRNSSNIYKEMKYSFIEYMSYKLKRYGKKGLPYLDILEEEVNKRGLTISEAIRKEHYDIANLKVSIGNSILSLKEISRINFSVLFEDINGVEEILKNDPANVYINMDYRTKEYYRNEIKKISKATKISEIYIAKKVLELANENFKNYSIDEKNKNCVEDIKKTHIGYYLISKGRKDLLKNLGVNNKKEISIKSKVKIYIFLIYLLTTIISLLLGKYSYNTSKNIYIAVLCSIISYIPISELVVQLVNYVLNKKVKPTLIPKLDLNNRNYKRICYICSCSNYY